jgi:hypothetical protein
VNKDDERNLLELALKCIGAIIFCGLHAQEVINLKDSKIDNINYATKKVSINHQWP